MSSCPVCDQPIPADARFCGRCGHQMQEAAKRAVLVGKTIASRYHVQRVIAEGGMGIVYEAEQPMGEGVRKVAIKTLLPELSRDPVVVSRFHRECSVVAGLDHPNTVRVYDFGSTDDGTLYIAMEFVRGRPLGDVIAEGPMPLQRVMLILEQVASALEEAHNQGIVHRDLKPDNLVLCDRAGLHDFVKVLDFGIAKRSSAGGKHDTNLTQQGMVLGTPPYMSPEQFSGEVLDRTSDVYSLAVIVYEMLNGRLPFEGDTPWQWAHQHMTVAPAPFSVTVPPGIEPVVLAALSKLRNDRPPTAVEFFRRLALCMPNDKGAHSRILEPTSIVPPFAASVALAPAQTAASSIGLHTEPSMLREGPNTVDDGTGPSAVESHTEPGAAPVMPFGSSEVGTYRHFTAASSTGTEPGAPRLVVSSSGAPNGLASGAAAGRSIGGRPSASGVTVVAPRVRWLGRSLLVALGILAIAGVATGVVLWVQWERDRNATPPRPTIALDDVEAVELAAESPSYPTLANSNEALSYPPPESRARAPSNKPTQSAPQPGTPTASASVPPVTPSAAPTAAQPSNPLQFPFPIALPSILSQPGLPPVQTAAPQAPPPATPPPATPPPATPPPATAGMQNCANASAMATSNLDAAVSQYLVCEGAVGRVAANATRAQIVAIGVAQARTLAEQGRCQEASRVVQTMGRIGAERPAQNAIARSKACR